MSKWLKAEHKRLEREIMERHELHDLHHRIIDLGHRAEDLRTTADVSELARVVGQIAAITERLIIDKLNSQRKVTVDTKTETEHTDNLSAEKTSQDTARTEENSRT